MSHYYESHVIIRHVGLRPAFFSFCKRYGFWCSEIEHDGGGEEAKGELIATTRDTDLERMKERMKDLIADAEDRGGSKVTRFKIEECVVDSNEGDKL